jgi:membrane protease YdiL (CAAX protease family)
VLLFDYSRTFVPHIVQALGRAPEAMRYQALERLILFGFVPLAIVLFLFRDSPMRYGVRLGEWRWGLGLAIAGCAVMTPIVLVLASVPHFRDYYGVSSADAGYVAVTNALDLVPAEFLMRGFLMFTLLRTIGPLGVLVATLPFVFGHLGKPEIELFSTLAGGLLYGWLNWRTGSIVWSAAAHVYIVTLMLVAAGS